jgi:hypothetical protein
MSVSQIEIVRKTIWEGEEGYVLVAAVVLPLTSLIVEMSSQPYLGRDRRMAEEDRRASAGLPHVPADRPDLLLVGNLDVEGRDGGCWLEFQRDGPESPAALTKSAHGP